MKASDRMSKMYRAALGVVLYQNSIEELTNLFRSIQAMEKSIQENQRSISLEVFLFDNGDSPMSYFEEVKISTNHHFCVHKLPENKGFGGGHNELMKQVFLDGVDAYIAVNPDGFFHPRCVEAFFDLSINHDHRALIEARQFPSEQPKAYDPMTFETEWCAGACLWISKPVYEATWGFDEGIFMYCEDVDISWRAQEAGLKTLLCPKAWFYHDLTDRFDNTPSRQKQQLLGSRYLGYRWNNIVFAHKVELQLFKRELISSGDELPSPPEPLNKITRQHKFDFRYAPQRW